MISFSVKGGGTPSNGFGQGAKEPLPQDKYPGQPEAEKHKCIGLGHRSRTKAPLKPLLPSRAVPTQPVEMLLAAIIERSAAGEAGADRRAGRSGLPIAGQHERPNEEHRQYQSEDYPEGSTRFASTL